MTKKPVRLDDAHPEKAAATVEAETLQTLLDEVIEDEAGRAIWTVGRWQTFKRWACALCTFDTLDGEAAMLAHYLAVHAPPPPPPPPPVVQVYDRYGRPV